MILSIHQPNYLPWLGFFFKIHMSDHFLILDDVQFSKNALTKRTLLPIDNKITTKKYLTVPVRKAPLHTLIKDVKFDEQRNWVGHHINRIKSIYHKEEYFDEWMSSLEEIIREAYETSATLSALNIIIITKLCDLLELSCQKTITSSVPVQYRGRNEYIVDLLQYFHARVYVSGSGARNYDNPQLYRLADIKCVYSDFYNHMKNTSDPIFQKIDPSLSIVDSLMKIGISEIKRCFREYGQKLENQF